MKHIILYSHGFGVDKTDRGLFSDIANTMPEAKHVMFEYDEKNEKGETIAKSFTDRKTKLLETYEKLRTQNPDAIIDLICHSQGCTIATLANLKGIRKTIFLAPPLNYENGEKERVKKLQHETVTELTDGTLSWLRRDGSITLIGPDFWQDYNNILDIKELINNLKHTTALSIIKAENDEVLTDNSYDGIDKTIDVIKFDADHNFTGESRSQIIDFVSNKLLEEK